MVRNEPGSNDTARRVFGHWDFLRHVTKAVRGRVVDLWRRLAGASHPAECDWLQAVLDSSCLGRNWLPDLIKARDLRAEPGPEERVNCAL